MAIRDSATHSSDRVIQEAASSPWSVAAARTFCRRKARSHYENFIVASLFLPRRLKQHFYNIYAYCRMSDDLADEAGNPRLALEGLEWWEQELHACYRGQPRHPIFVALSETIETFDIPMAPFADLLLAFKQDQTKRRYATFDELLDYCRYSANPVGHLVLYVCGYRDEERQRLSDSTCTALQLANHWQDVARDLTRLDRVYLPREDMDRFGYSEADLRAHVCDGRFVDLMRLEVGRTWEFFNRGLRLCQLVGSRLALDIELFSRCGMEILRRLETAHYDVFACRPTLSRWERTKILARCCWARGVGGDGG